jgi:hypothetical protein
MIARSGMGPDQLRAFLSHPHGAMPDLALTRAEIETSSAISQRFAKSHVLTPDLNS